MMGRYVISALLLLVAARSGSGELNEPITAVEDTTHLVQTWHSPSADSPSVQKLEVATSVSNTTGMTSVAMPGLATSHGPMATSNEVASTTMKAVNNGLPTATPALNEPSATLRTVEVNGSETSTVDHGNGSSSTTHTGTVKGAGSTDIMDTGDRGDPYSIPKRPVQETTKAATDDGKEAYKKEVGKVILIAVLMFSLVLLLVLVVIFMCRKKKRSGSFRTHSRKNAKQDVWAGQVPELGDGKAPRNSTLAENGRAGNETVKEQEMTTFVNGEKKLDSVEEMDELGSGEAAEGSEGEELGKEDTAEEKAPLLGETSPNSEDTVEQLPVPAGEQELLANGVQ